MPESLRILILEDRPIDIELVEFELREAGLAFTANVAMTEKEYVQALQESSPDLILSDYDLPRYNGALALAEARRRCPDTPFILVTGAVSEDRAIEILTQGAKDYVLKSRLQQRLVPAVRRALAEAEEQKARRKAEEELRTAHKDLESQVAERTAELQKQVEHRRQIEEALLRYNERLELLSYTASRLLASDKPQQLVEELCRKVMAFLDCDAFFNFLVDENAGRLHLNACGGIPVEAVREIEWLDYGVAVCGCAARDACRIVAEDIPTTPDVRTELVKSFGIKAYACHPLKEQNRVMGTLSFGTRLRTTFSTDDLALMKAVADQVAIALVRVGTEAALRKTKAELEKRVEERTCELRAASLYARSLIEASLDPLVTISADGKIMDVNHASEEATGVTRLKLIGTDFSDYFTVPEKARAGYEKVFREGFVRDYPLEMRHRKGHVTPVLYNASVYRDETGKIVGVFASARDITERKRAEEALQKAYGELEKRVEERTRELTKRTAQMEAANKELESFSYSVSHDLRAPLRAIDGYSRMILRGQGDKFDENTRRQFDRIMESARMMGQLIDDLLALSRLGREALSLSGMNVADLAREVWEELKVNNPDGTAEMKIGHIPPGAGDRSLIKQVFVNIFANAIKFTRVRPAPLVEVGGYGTETENVYYIRDNGVGFDMQYHDKLFGVFQRLHSTEDYEGTGVGLAIVQRIIHRHGGRVWAEGKVDEGACFYFTLPRG